MIKRNIKYKNKQLNYWVKNNFITEVGSDYKIILSVNKAVYYDKFKKYKNKDVFNTDALPRQIKIHLEGEACFELHLENEDIVINHESYTLLYVRIRKNTFDKAIPKDKIKYINIDLLTIFKEYDTFEKDYFVIKEIRKPKNKIFLLEKLEGIKIKSFYKDSENVKGSLTIKTFNRQTGATTSLLEKFIKSKKKALFLTKFYETLDDKIDLRLFTVKSSSKKSIIKLDDKIEGFFDNLEKTINENKIEELYIDSSSNNYDKNIDKSISELYLDRNIDIIIHRSIDNFFKIK